MCCAARARRRRAPRRGVGRLWRGRSGYPLGRSARRHRRRSCIWPGSRTCPTRWRRRPPTPSPASTPRGPRGSPRPPCAAGVRRFVLMSSALVHGQASPGRPFTESDAPAPATPYARSKLDSERRLDGGGARQRAGMGHPAPADGVWAGRARQLPPPGPAGAHRRAAAARRRHGAQELHRHRQPGRCRGARVEHPRAANQVFLRRRCGDHLDRRPRPPHRRGARPARVDAAVPPALLRSRSDGRARARLSPPVRSAGARHQPHPRRARLVAAGHPGRGPAPRRRAE